MQVETVKQGDHVIPLTSCAGTWQYEVVLEARDVHVVPKELDLDAAAQLVIKWVPT